MKIEAVSGIKVMAEWPTAGRLCVTPTPFSFKYISTVAYIWRLEEDMQESFLSFYPMDSRDQTQLTRLGAKNTLLFVF